MSMENIDSRDIYVTHSYSNHRHSVEGGHRSRGNRVVSDRDKYYNSVSNQDKNHRSDCYNEESPYGNPAQRFLQKDIFEIKYSDIEDIPKLRHLRYGFVDEDDFEEFKQDILDFRELKRKSKEYSKRDPNKRLSKTAESRNLVNKSPDLFMEFFNSDEHFKEFERVFETVKSKRFSNSLDRLRYSLHKYDESDDSEDDDDDRTLMLDEDDLSYLDDPQDDLFSEFFNNDEDFKEFEREFQTFKVKRRSRALDRINRNSGCDIVTELKAICDKDPTEKYDALIAAGEPRLWNSGGEWDYIFKHIKRNNRRSTDLSATYGSNTSIQTLTDYDYDSDTGIFTSDTELHISEKCSENSGENVRTDQSCPRSTYDNDCSFTCHQKCAEMVRLGCKSSPNDVPEEPQSLETSLSEASDTSHNASNDGVTEASNEKDETDSGYRSGTIPDEKLPRQPSQATLNREELKKKFEEYNTLVPGANFQLKTEKDESFQGFIKVTLNLVRPICMSLGARPPSIYEVLTKEHIIEQNTQTISFYMPRDTVKSIHVCSEISTKEVISLLLKKFHILDNPRKFALYEQELSEKGKIVRLRRIPETDFPLQVALQWEPVKIESIRFVLQENESGEVNWEAFSLPELGNFLRVLDREEAEYTSQLEYKYKVMKRIVLQRLKELRKERRNSKLQASLDKRDSMTES